MVKYVNLTQLVPKKWHQFSSVKKKVIYKFHGTDFLKFYIDKLCAIFFHLVHLDFLRLEQIMRNFFVVYKLNTGYGDSWKNDMKTEEEFSHANRKSICPDFGKNNN